MYWCKRLALLVLTGWCWCSAYAEPGDFVVGAGAEADSEDGLSLGLIGDIGLGQSTWLSASLAHSGIDVPLQQEIDTWYADLGLDHFFDPVGVRLGLAYWGSSELLESSDVRASVYSRGEGGSLSIDAEHRDFDFNLQAIDILPQLSVGFSASGLGLSGRMNVADRLSIRASGMRYEYSREFGTADSDRVAAVLTNSRLSVLSSLVDWRAGIGVAVDVGLRQLQLDLARWRGVVDKSDNFGATISFLTPMTSRTDIEISLGRDDSDLYGDVTVLSVFVYFYGGN